MKTTEDLNHTKTILVLTDFTKSALNAADYALFLALELKTNLLLYHSYYTSVSELDSLQITGYASLAKNSKSNLEKEMNRLNNTITPDHSNFKPRIDYLTEGGGVAENVCSIIDIKKNVLMLVMGGCKAQNNDDILFGTEITAIASKARCPLVIVPELGFIRV